MSNSTVNLDGVKGRVISGNESRAPLSDDSRPNTLFGELLAKFNLPNVLVDEEVISEDLLSLLDVSQEDLGMQLKNVLITAEESNFSDITGNFGEKISSNFLYDIQESFSIGKLNEGKIELVSQGFDSIETQINEDIDEEIEFGDINDQFSETMDNGIENTESLYLGDRRDSDNNKEGTFKKDNESFTYNRAVTQEKFIKDTESEKQSAEVELQNNNEYHFDHNFQLSEKNNLKYSILSANQAYAKYEKLDNLYNREAILDQLKVHLNKLTPESNKVTIQLKPEELGFIEVEVNFKNQLIQELIVRVEKADTYSILQKDNNELKTALNNLGFEFSETALTFNLESNNQDQGQYRQSKKKLYESIESTNFDITKEIVRNFINVDGRQRIDITV